MLTHRRIWDAIDSLAAKHGLSTSGLAKRAGLDPTTFNKSKRISVDGKPRWPSTESIAKILEATASTVADFVTLLDGAAAPLPSSTEALHIELPLGGTVGGERAMAPADVDHHPSVATLPTLETGKLLAIRVLGDSMAPVYRDGDLLVVAPAAEIRDGDRVAIKTRADDILVGELVHRAAEQTILRPLGPTVPERTLAGNDISWIGRIMLVGQ